MLESGIFLIFFLLKGVAGELLRDQFENFETVDYVQQRLVLPRVTDVGRGLFLYVISNRLCAILKRVVTNAVLRLCQFYLNECIFLYKYTTTNCSTPTNHEEFLRHIVKSDLKESNEFSNSCLSSSLRVGGLVSRMQIDNISIVAKVFLSDCSIVVQNDLE